MKRTNRQIIMLAWALILVCLLCLPGAALARGEMADAAGSQGGSLEKSSVSAQVVPANPVAEKALASAKVSLETQTSVAGIATDDSFGATWVNRSPSGSPAGRFEYAMAYDSQNHKVILFGGSGSSGFLEDTWAYDYAANTWTNRNPANSPTGRRSHAMTYDASSSKVILFGGWDINSSRLNDTWAYDYAGNTWTKLGTNSSPSARRDHAMAYDSQDGKTILFGGSDSSSNLNDTWEYNYAGNTWTNRSPANSPQARSRHAMAYDSQNHKVILFGGYGSSRLLNDTWVYDYATNVWTNRSPANSPPGRVYHAMVYDSQNIKAILFGGGSNRLLNDTWVYDYADNAWTNRSPANSPTGRRSHAMAYDASSGKMILFGGWDGSSSRLDDTWAFTLPPDNVTLEYELLSGWNLISIPLVLANPSPEAVIPIGWPLYSWNAVANTYLGRSQITLAIGKSCWLKTPTPYHLSITGQPNMEHYFTIPLSQGWNLIGAPYEAAFDWSTVRMLKVPDTIPLDLAIATGWIKSPFYSWTGSSYQGLVSGGIFQSMAGYWVNAVAPGCSLIFYKPE